MTYQMAYAIQTDQGLRDVFMVDGDPATDTTVMVEPRDGADRNPFPVAADDLLI